MDITNLNKIKIINNNNSTINKSYFPKCGKFKSLLIVPNHNLKLKSFILNKYLFIYLIFLGLTYLNFSSDASLKSTLY